MGFVKKKNNLPLPEMTFLFLRNSACDLIGSRCILSCRMLLAQHIYLLFARIVFYISTNQLYEDYLCSIAVYDEYGITELSSSPLKFTGRYLASSSDIPGNLAHMLSRITILGNCRIRNEFTLY